MQVRFDRVTDGGGLASCSKLLVFRCAEHTQCRWTDSQALTIGEFPSNMTAEECVMPGDRLGLQSTARIRSLSDGSDWVNTSTVLLVQGPVSTVVPSVFIAVPKVLSACDSMVLDVSGSSGGGGRAWLNATWRVQSSMDGVVYSPDTDLSSYLQAQWSLGLPLRLDGGEHVSAGTWYQMELRLCNFFGLCGMYVGEVKVQQESIPSLTISGGLQRSVTRGSSLSLLAAVAYRACGNESVSAAPTSSDGSLDLSVLWYVSSDDQSKQQIQSQS